MHLGLAVFYSLIILYLIKKVIDGNLLIQLRHLMTIDSFTGKRILRGERVCLCRKCFSAYSGESLSKISHGNGERCLKCSCDLKKHGLHLG
jgi:hypothetical protein